MFSCVVNHVCNVSHLDAFVKEKSKLFFIKVYRLGLTEIMSEKDVGLDRTIDNVKSDQG